MVHRREYSGGSNMDFMLMEREFSLIFRKITVTDRRDFLNNQCGYFANICSRFSTNLRRFFQIHVVFFTNSKKRLYCQKINAFYREVCVNTYLLFREVYANKD